MVNETKQSDSNINIRITVLNAKWQDESGEMFGGG